MTNLFKKLLAERIKDSSANTAILSEPDLTIARANNEMQLLTQAAIEMWGLDTAAWDVDLNTGTITFTNDEKEIMVTAPVQVVGTSTILKTAPGYGGGTIRQSASHLENMPGACNDFGEQYGKETLTTRKIAASMDDARELLLFCLLSRRWTGEVIGEYLVQLVFYGPMVQ